MRKVIFLAALLSLMLQAQEECTKCHQEQSAKCKNSPHYTLSNAINITRQAWGITDSNVTLQTLPQSKTKIEKPADLVDDFLRRKCLKCHIFNRSSGEKGMKRGTGCLSCHTPHQENGKCQRKPYIPDTKCLTCHNKGYTGGEYGGLFPKDHHRSYRAPLTQDGHFPPQRYGSDYHHLNEDIHHAKGIRCTQCHTSANIQGLSKATCTSCHTSPTPTNHPQYHEKIACVACHSSWGYSAYELSVFRDDTADYAQWKDLKMQEDGYLANFLAHALKSKKKIQPRMPDWIDRKMKSGIWYSGYRYKRWEDVILANYDDGRIGLVRPLYQYRISYRDSNGAMVLDDVSSIDDKPIEAWIPYSPHTITRHAKSCERCHANPMIMNPYYGGNEVMQLRVPKKMIGAKPLSKDQIERMKSMKHKKIRASQL